MDAQTLFREGVTAVREGKDLNQARQLLLQSLKLEPQNEMAWLWLAQTTSDPQKKLECVNRALKINPENAKALELRLKLTKAITHAQDAAAQSAALSFDPDEKPKPPPRLAEKPVPRPAPPPEPEPDLIDEGGLRAAPTIRTPLTAAEEEEVKALLAQAEVYLKSNQSEDIENAIEQWVRILEIRVDHEVAIQNSVRYLARLGYMDDAKELIWRAIDAGTLLPSIFVTAVDIAQRMHDHSAAADMAKRLLPMPEIDDALLLKITDQMVKYGQAEQVVDVLEAAVTQRPKSQKLLIRLGELLDEMGQKDRAMRYFDRAARIKGGTKEAKRADKALMQYTPIITDRERGSTGLAVREASGFVLFYLLLGWQDAGLNLFNMGIRWLGVLLAFVGGYFVITAVSSPQQQPLARWLGGTVPPAKPQRQTVDAYGNPIDTLAGGPLEDPTDLPILPSGVRGVFFILGAALLLVSFYLVFSTALRLLVQPVPPTYIPSIEELLQEAIR
ncbi:MAG: tetratricopeptide repeat protein [Chloroflexi bacterium]|nr:tetratricopeptide repeat protein [Chloroflexota bacterium]